MPRARRETAEALQALSSSFAYDPSSGVLTNKAKQRAVGCPATNGYMVFKFRGRQYKVHRVAWALHTGAWPVDQIDHANGIKADNRFCNLREATPQQNSCNQRRPRNNTSGYKGLWRNRNKWAASIAVGRKRRFLGSFETKEAAYVAYQAAAAELHGKFARYD